MLDQLNTNNSMTSILHYKYTRQIAEPNVNGILLTCLGEDSNWAEVRDSKQSVATP